MLFLSVDITLEGLVTMLFLSVDITLEGLVTMLFLSVDITLEGLVTMLFLSVGTFRIYISCNIHLYGLWWVTGSGRGSYIN
jgi:hypothetical protein